MLVWKRLKWCFMERWLRGLWSSVLLESKDLSSLGDKSPGWVRWCGLGILGSTQKWAPCLDDVYSQFSNHVPSYWVYERWVINKYRGKERDIPISVPLGFSQVCYFYSGYQKGISEVGCSGAFYPSSGGERGSTEAGGSWPWIQPGLYCGSLSTKKSKSKYLMHSAHTCWEFIH